MERVADGEPRRAQKNRPIYTLNIPGSARNARNPPLARFPPSPLPLPSPLLQFLTRVMSFSPKTAGNECICGLIGGRAAQSPTQTLKA